MTEQPTLSLLCFLVFHLYPLNFKKASLHKQIVLPCYLFIFPTGVNTVFLNTNYSVFRIPPSEAGKKQGYIKILSQVAV